MGFGSIADILRETDRLGCTIGQLMLKNEAENSEADRAEILARMQANWQVMKASVAQGIDQPQRSKGGLTGGDAQRLYQYSQSGQALGGGNMARAVSYALSVAEVNATMGKIVACPTAGSCGIVPAVLLTVQERLNLEDEQMVLGLMTAAAVGTVIAAKASIAGAVGGCQAECGSAAAMAAAAAVELAGGTPAQAAHSCAMALKNVLGLVCDPVAGLVEVPCVKRNALGASLALVSADMALAGIESVIPADEVIVAMGEVGRTLPASLRETALGGLAVTPTGLSLAEKIKGN